ncbi:Hint domain-containing protein [Paracoccus sp. (in: a-proteobacteria)]|uniref:Hint domain-containing protein n=1 Tax=Paracoccus sp. TaxID=267 RepID=UPI002897F76E|nr:Hint domain-containing protein [Paracoccus sp. (in: a-proteobacteria)]
MAGIDQTIAFVSKEDVKTSAGDWLLNSNNGQGVPGHTFTFNASAALKSLIVNDDDGMFSDDDLPNQPISWGGDALGQTVAAGSEVGEVGKGVEAEYLLTMTATIDGELKTFEILVVQQGGKTIGYAFKGEIPPFGVTLKATGYLDSTQGPGGTYNPVGTPYKDIVTCFAAGTMIQTSTGARAIEKLNVGDKVLTKDSGYQELRWIGSTAISAQQLSARPKLTPVRITAGPLGIIPRNPILWSRPSTASFFARRCRANILARMRCWLPQNIWCRSMA